MRLPKGKLLALVALVLAASMVMATGAFSSVTADRSVDVKVVGDKKAFLALEPADSENGKAYADTKGNKLVVNLDGDAKVKGQGVNPDAITSFDKVFTITNHGSQAVNVWIEDTSKVVKFYKGGNPKDTINSQSSKTKLNVGDTIKVGIVVDTTKGAAAGDTLIKAITIHAVAPNSGEAPGGEGNPQDPS